MEAVVKRQVRNLGWNDVLCDSLGRGQERLHLFSALYPFNVDSADNGGHGSRKETIHYKCGGAQFSDKPRPSPPMVTTPACIH